MKNQYMGLKFFGLLFLILMSFCFFTTKAMATSHGGTEYEKGQQSLQEKVKMIQDMFSSKEGKIVSDYQGNITIRLSGLNFDSGQSMINPQYHPLLANVYKAAQMFPDRKIKITGHTDSVGSNQFNKRLSEKRAQAIAQYMQEQYNVKPDQIEVFGAGEDEPIATNTTPMGRKLNRRIDITFLAE